MTGKLFRVAASAVLLVAAGGCGSSESGGGQGGSGGSGGSGSGGGAGAGGVVTITLFHTSDEEGALAPDNTTDPTKVIGGVANFRSWLAAEGYDPSKHLLVSSGDNWTGQAVSTWFEGKSTVEVMNLLGYRAAAIGNHEFDFDTTGLAARASEATFPYLSANISELASGQPPAWATPYTIVEVGGVRVGFLGLTTRTSATSAHPRFVAALTFDEEKLNVERTVPNMRADGAEMVIVLAHECSGPITTALSGLSVRIDGLLTGHCNEYGVSEQDGFPVVSSDHFWGAFTRLDYQFDSESRQVVDYTVKQTRVEYPVADGNPVTPDAAVAQLVDSWQQRASNELSKPVGHTLSGFLPGTWQTANWFVDAWLAEFPGADAAILNFGSLRTPVPQGAFSLADVVGMAPFNNSLVQVEISGATLKAALKLTAAQVQLAGPKAAVGGLKYRAVAGDVEVTLDDGATFDESATYTVIITDYMYYGGNDYDFQSDDPTPSELGAHMRDPVVTWTTKLDSSATDPVEAHVDSAPRDQG